MDDADALRYARMGGHVQLIPGSAAAALVARDGSWHAAETAWIAAAKQANVGAVELRSSRVPGVNGTSEGLSFDDAEDIHQRIAGLFDDESTRFERLKHLVGDAGDPDTRSLTYRSVLWPDFVFTATSDDDGGLESAEYRRARGKAQKAASPRGTAAVEYGLIRIR
ncbi:MULTISPECIES: hypothetical protein [Mycobacteriaceae]|uniref:hypothetical protein n=1 Tax=Mycobacteriaceae TaxID=1762 RepID=UPI000769B6AB|nr:hypothetical protein [Mycolicibacterium mucogenicum]